MFGKVKDSKEEKERNTGKRLGQGNSKGMEGKGEKEGARMRRGKDRKGGKYEAYKRERGKEEQYRDLEDDSHWGREKEGETGGDLQGERGRK